MSSTIVLDDGVNRIELTIVGYEFPDVEDGPDANWLQVAVNVEARDLRWQFEDAALTTAELVELSEWLQDAARGGLPAPLEFTEPVLRFRLEPPRDQATIISCGFAYEGHPGGLAADMSVYWLPLSLSPREITAAAAGVKTALQEFPPRD